MKTIWKLPDFIDLEYFFHRDVSAGSEDERNEIRTRDREIYLTHIYPEIKKQRALSRRFIIKRWLEIRRKQLRELLASEAILPGGAFKEIYNLLLAALAFSGALAGSVLAFSLLTYSGTEPLNVAIYFATLVVTQILGLLIFFLFFLWRHLSFSSYRSSFLYSLVSRLLSYLTIKIKRQTDDKVPRAHIEGFRAAIGLIAQKRRIYGSLFYWPVFISAQVFGVFFNIGAIAATLLKVLGSDIAFGWQSTVQFSPQLVHNTVKAISLPWAWIVPDEIAYPTLAEIVGSRIILKEGIYHLATQDLVAWWPFLCLSLIAYGLVPRLILLTTGIAGLNISLFKQDLSQGSCDQLIYRLETPRLSSLGAMDKKDSEENRKNIGSDDQSGNESPREVLYPKISIIALVHDDIFGDFSDDELRDVMRKNIGYDLHEKIRIGKDLEHDSRILAGIAEREWKEQEPAIFLLQEAWQPPIEETLAFIKTIREMMGKKAKIILGLIGKPGPHTFFTPVEDRDWNVWKKNIDILGDPFLRLERVVVNES